MLSWLARTLSPEEVEAPVRLPPGVAVRKNALITWLGGRLSGAGKPASAVTLGRTIVVHPAAKITARLITHELEHVKQFQTYPTSFMLRYLVNHFRYGYYDNPYEVAARAAEKSAHET